MSIRSSNSALKNCTVRICTLERKVLPYFIMVILIFIFHLQDIVDPVTDEMLARFVVDSHARSIPKGSNLEERAQSGNDGAGPTDPDVSIHQHACQFFFSFHYNSFSNKIFIEPDIVTRYAQEVYNICKAKYISKTP